MKKSLQVLKMRHESLRTVKLFVLTTIVAFSLAGCSTTGITSIIGSEPSKDWDSLYLRGTVTWWDADERFRLKKVSSTLYMVETELVADGQPYDFKFADKDWTPGLRCGYADKEKDEVLSPGSVSAANCDTPVDNFRFTPEKSGTYYFYFDITNEDQPLVYVSQTKK